MGILAWIILGLIAGVIAQFLVGGGFGIIGSIILGIVGAVVGGFAIGFGAVDGFDIRSVVIAVIGAIVVLLIARSLRGPATAVRPTPGGARRLPPSRRVCSRLAAPSTAVDGRTVQWRSSWTCIAR